MKTINFIALLITPSLNKVYMDKLFLLVSSFNIDWVMYRWHNDEWAKLFIDTLSPLNKILLLNIPFSSPKQALELSSSFAGVHLKSHLIDYISLLKRAYPQDSQKIIGYSAHSVAEVIYALELGADYCTLSPIFQTPNKGLPIGLEALEEIPYHLRARVIALGGITSIHFEALRGLGLGGFAGISYFQSLKL